MPGACPRHCALHGHQPRRQTGPSLLREASEPPPLGGSLVPVWAMSQVGAALVAWVILIGKQLPLLP
jgi:hypothetical protein